MTVPDWLAKRGGSFVPGIQGSVFVVLDGKPQFRLDARPAAGKIGCVITQTVNGKQSVAAGTYPDVPAALAGGLEHLRANLGW